VDQAHEDSIWSVSWTGGTTNKLVTGGVDEHVKVWYAHMPIAFENASNSRDAGTWQLARTFPLLCMSLLANPQTNDSFKSLRDGETFQCIATLEGHQMGVVSVVVDRTGKCVFIIEAGTRLFLSMLAIRCRLNTISRRKRARVGSCQCWPWVRCGLNICNEIPAPMHRCRVELSGQQYQDMGP
jgi:hypothetical protein